MNRLAIQLTDPNDARLDHYRDLRGRGAGQGDRFVAEGFYLLERLVASDYPIESIVSSESALRRIHPLAPADIPIYVLSNSAIERLTGFDFHRGVLACAKRRQSPNLEALVTNATDRQTLVILPHIHDQTNLGGILRNCAAFGVDAVVMGANCTDQLGRRTLRVSMGASLARSITHVADVTETLYRLRNDFDFHIAAATTHQEAIPMERFRRPERLGILLGPEGDGLSQDLIDAANSQVTIPMAPSKSRSQILATDSLNVAVSSGILLYGLTRPTV